MAVGEFVALHAVAGDPLDVQIRTVAVAETVSSIGAVAVGLGGARITVSTQDPAVLRIDGVATMIDPLLGPLDVGGGKLFFDGLTYTVEYPDHELVRITDRGAFLDLSVVASGLRPAGQFSGLLGNLDGDPLNDLALPDGTVLAQPVAFTDLYGAFADGWRVTNATSLFDYGPGETTASFSDPFFPMGVVRVADLPPDLVARAAAIVAAAGVTNPVQADAAILDLILTGNPAYVTSAARQPMAIAAATQPAGVPQVDAVGVSGPLQPVVEWDAGETPVTFTFWRTGDVSQPMSADWELVLGSASFADLAFGTPTAGPIDFLAGERSATLSLSVLGDTLVEPDEDFSVAIVAAPPGVLVASGVAPVTILDDDAPPALNDSPVALPDSYAVARGRVADIAAAFGVGANDSDPNGDALAYALLAGPPAGEGSVAVNADGSFTFTGEPNFVGLTSFTYSATDSGGLSATATVALTVEERAETLFGTDAEDRIFGYGLDDVISGLGGADRLFGGDGDDTIHGGDGEDRISGDAGNDILVGGAGTDRLRGGAGQDWLTGGAGADLFVLANAAAERDWITDFQSGSDLLQIEAALFGAGLTPGALDASRLVVGANRVATQPGVGQFLFSTTTGALRWDADGAGGAAAQIIASLGGVASLSASDFIVV